MRIDDLLQRLPLKGRRGSKARCHLLTHGRKVDVAARLTALIAPWGEVSENDNWMPKGFCNIEEAQLHKAPLLLNEKVGKCLELWWLRFPGGTQTLPSFDIASTCTIDGRRGLLLVEAKAHDEELRKVEEGKKLRKNASDKSKANHMRIGECIKEANQGLGEATELKWNLSRDCHYQMSNRFTWGWKLTELGQLGLSVILVYLGFLEADEMNDAGNPFADHAEWESAVKSHSEPLFPARVWDKKWMVNDQAFIPLIRSMKQPLEVRV